MPLRTKQGRWHVVSAPQKASEGRRQSITTGTAARLPATIEARQVRVGLAILEREKARQQEQRKPSASATEARKKAERATSYRLHELKDAATRDAGEHRGREVARDTIEAFTGPSFRLLLRALANADLELQHYAIEAMLRAGDIAREHNVTSSAASAMLARSVVWDALAQRLQHAALTSTALDADAVKLAALAGRESRLDTLGALQLARASAEPTTPTIDVQARVRAYELKRATDADTALEADGDADADTEGMAGGDGHADPDQTAALADDATAKRFAVTADETEHERGGATDRKRPRLGPNPADHLGGAAPKNTPLDWDDKRQCWVPVVR